MIMLRAVNLHTEKTQKPEDNMTEQRIEKKTQKTRPKCKGNLEKSTKMERKHLKIHHSNLACIPTLKPN